MGGGECCGEVGGGECCGEVGGGECCGEVGGGECCGEVGGGECCGEVGGGECCGEVGGGEGDTCLCGSCGQLVVLLLQQLVLLAESLVPQSQLSNLLVPIPDVLLQIYYPERESWMYKMSCSYGAWGIHSF